jgi:hypothetical protein
VAELRAFRRCHSLDSEARDHLAERIRGPYAGLSPWPKTLAPDALLELGGFGVSIKAEQFALFGPAERNAADAQDLSTRQINWLSAIDNRGDNVRCKVA